MERPSLEYQAFDDYSLAVNRNTLEQRLRKLLGGSEKSAEHALLYIGLNGDAGAEPGRETNVEKAFLSILMKDMVWASSIEDCVARIKHSEFAMLMAFCPLTRALQTARLLRLWFRAGVESNKQSGNMPDLHIGIIPAVTGCEPRQVLAQARNACESAKRRGRESICVLRIETGSRTTCIEREDHADNGSVSDKCTGESRPSVCRLQQ